MAAREEEELGSPRPLVLYAASAMTPDTTSAAVEGNPVPGFTAAV